MAIDLLSAGVTAVPLLLFLLRRDSGRTLALKLCLGLYLIAVFSAAGVPSILGMRWDPDIQWIPLMEMAGDFSSNVKTALLNAVLFLPLGALLPLIWKEFRGAWFRVAVLGFALSLFIELLQLFNFRLTDVDDLLMNMVGTLIGYGAVMKVIYVGAFHGDALSADGGKELCAYGQLFLIFLTAFLSMFFVQPFVSELFY